MEPGKIFFYVLWGVCGIGIIACVVKGTIDYAANVFAKEFAEELHKKKRSEDHETS